MKKFLGIGIGMIGLLIGTLLVVPAFVDLGIFKRTYLPIIEEAIRRRVDVSEVRLTLIPTPSIRLSNLRVSDSPAFPDNIFFATLHGSSERSVSRSVDRVRVSTSTQQ